MSEVTWRQRKIQVKNEKVRLFLLSLQEFEDEIKVKSFNSVQLERKIISYRNQMFHLKLK